MGLFGPPDVEKLKAKGDVPGLIKALGYGKDWKVRWAAVGALGKIGDARAVEPLIVVLNDEDRNVRWGVAEALGQIGDPRAVDSLMATLNDSSVSRAAARALVKIGAPAVEPLIAVFTGGTWEVHWFAAEALGQIGDARAVEPLIAGLTGQYVGEAVATSLGQIRDPRAVEPLVAALKYQTASVRKGVIEALAKFGAAAVEPLITALRDQNKSVRKAAAETLGKIGDPRAVEPLIAAQEDQSPGVRKAAAEALGQGKTPAAARNKNVAPAKTKRAVALVEEYVNKDHPLDVTMQMLGVKRTRPIYNVVQNRGTVIRPRGYAEVQRGSHPHIDMKIVSVASCLPGEDVDARDTTKVARLALEAIQHYASIPNVQAFFLLPYRLGTKTVVEGSAVPPEETCRVYSGVENLLLEIYDELPNGGTITDKVVEQKIDELSKSVQ